MRDVTRNKAGGVCSFGVNTKFAYVYHRRRGARVYLRGNEADGEQLAALAGTNGFLTVTKRRSMGSPWAKLTPHFIDFDSEDGALMAAPLLAFAAAGLKEQRKQRGYIFPSELDAKEILEGARMMVHVSRVERDPAARRRCIQIFGTVCQVCGFDFSTKYGEIGRGFIHIHHLVPLKLSKGHRKVDPATDLRPVCPNCHEMLHKKDPPYTIEELRNAVLGEQG